MKEVDFHIDVRPVSISLECSYCYTDVVISWEDINVPDYWGDDWDEVECPHCNKSIKLGNYEYD